MHVANSKTVYLGYSDLNGETQTKLGNNKIKVTDIKPDNFNFEASKEIRSADNAIFIHINERSLIKSKY